MKSALLCAAALIPSASAAQTFANPATVAPPISTYTHVAIVPPDSELLVLAGQIGNAPDGSVAAGAEAQYEQALRNIVAIVRSEGATPGNIVKLTTYLVDPIDRDRARAIRERILGTATPPSTLVYVVRLARSDIKVEIDAMAMRPATNKR